MEIDKYLKMHLKSNLFFHYSKEENKILVTIDSPEWGDFFEQRDYVILFLVTKLGDDNI